MMRLHRKFLAATALTLAAAAGTAAIAQITSTNVAFPRGATSTTVRGTLVGGQIRDYVVRASAGQVMRVSKTGSPNVYFNVMAPGSSGEAIATVSTEGDRFSGTLSRGGPYTIRVYQMRATARRGERGSYALDIGVTGRGSAATQLPARPPAATGGGISGLRGIRERRRLFVRQYAVRHILRPDPQDVRADDDGRWQGRQRRRHSHASQVSVTLPT